MTVYILIDEVDIIGVYRNKEAAWADARRYELGPNTHVQESQLK